MAKKTPKNPELLSDEGQELVPVSGDDVVDPASPEIVVPDNATVEKTEPVGFTMVDRVLDSENRSAVNDISADGIGLGYESEAQSAANNGGSADPRPFVEGPVSGFELTSKADTLGTGDLTPEETEQVINEALAKRQAEKDTEAAAKQNADSIAKAKDERRGNPDGFVGLDYAEQGDYTYRRLNHGKSRTLLVDRVNFEHVDTDAEGVWLYRVMP